jgi:hypothetical protein
MHRVRQKPPRLKHSFENMAIYEGKYFDEMDIGVQAQRLNQMK